MTTFKVISVNPSEKTKGELCSGQIYRKLIRGKKISYEKQDAGEWLLNFLFPTRKSGFRLSVLLLSIRLIFATLLIYNGVEIISGAYSIAVMPDSVSGYMILAAGILLIAGFLTRITSFIISVFLIFLSVTTLSGSPDQLAILMCFLSLTLCIAGPGWISVDALIQRAAANSISKKKRKSKKLSVAEQVWK